MAIVLVNLDGWQSFEGQLFHETMEHSVHASTSDTSSATTRPDAQSTTHEDYDCF